MCVRSSLDGGLDSTNGQPVCGDDIMSGAEECDDGPLNNDTVYGGCTTQCTLGPRCGDNRIDDAEQCDLGDLNGKPFYISDATDAGTSSMIEDPRGIVWCDSNCRSESGLCVICPGLDCRWCE